MFYKIINYERAARIKITNETMKTHTKKITADVFFKITLIVRHFLKNHKHQ